MWLQKEVDGFLLSFTVPKIQKDLKPLYPYGNRLWETFIFNFLSDDKQTLILIETGSGYPMDVE